MVVECARACGKTWTGRRFAAGEVRFDELDTTRLRLEIEPASLLTGTTPRLGGVVGEGDAPPACGEDHAGAQWSLPVDAGVAGGARMRRPAAAGPSDCVRASPRRWRPSDLFGCEGAGDRLPDPR